MTGAQQPVGQAIIHELAGKMESFLKQRCSKLAYLGANYVYLIKLNEKLIDIAHGAACVYGKSLLIHWSFYERRSRILLQHNKS